MGREIAGVSPHKSNLSIASLRDGKYIALTKFEQASWMKKLQLQETFGLFQLKIYHVKSYHYISNAQEMFAKFANTIIHKIHGMKILSKETFFTL